MAAVYLGRLVGPAGFSRVVAVKRLHEQYAQDPAFVSMFLDEARIAARIRHPNVVPTLDVVFEQGELFLVLEYVEGEPLSGLIRKAAERGERVPLPIVLAVFIHVLQGLDAAHEATDDAGRPLGIIHRDVSPQNVIVGTDGVARVLDFGVAKAAGRVHHTKSGATKGKIAYMAPEQIVLRDPLTRAVDIYSTSVMLWETLVGRRHLDSESDAQMLHAILYEAVPAPTSAGRTCRRSSTRSSCAASTGLRARGSRPPARWRLRWPGRAAWRRPWRWPIGSEPLRRTRSPGARRTSPSCRCMAGRLPGSQRGRRPRWPASAWRAAFPGPTHPRRFRSRGAPRWRVRARCSKRPPARRSTSRNGPPRRLRTSSSSARRERDRWMPRPLQPICTRVRSPRA
jgi:serine/threonine protein kinase